MQQALQRLLDILDLTPLGEDNFDGQSQDLGWGAIFGGQVLGQGLRAAYHTVPDDRTAHSLHAYFLRRGDASKPVRLEVDRSRDGRSFTSRRVVALQEDKPILHMSVSFQIAEPGHSHQADVPAARGPDGVYSERDLALLFKEQIPEALRTAMTSERAIELRDVDPVNPLALQPKGPDRQVWLRAADTLPDDPILHQCLLAYASDFYLLSTSMRPHAVHWIQPEMKVTSLDHSLWFHSPAKMDDWLLHAMLSPWAGSARGLVHGRFYDRAGHLVASSAQEGLMRDYRLRDGGA
jgi:acyl-CoA thioesterase-2